MKKHVLLLGLAVAGTVVVAGWFLSSHNVPLLSPKGTIAEQQRELMLIATLLMLVVVVPVYIMLAYIPYKYRQSNHKARYTPDWDGNRVVEAIWWLVPLAIILILAGITFKSSHDLDPFKPIEADKKQLTVQVVALRWKWLFIYPEQNIASVNQLYIPKDTPVEFQITSDAPMNSFWIPQLGGQVYAMSGMTTKLHLLAEQEGSYAGSSANISGRGFSGMKFSADVSSQAVFDEWVRAVRLSQAKLDDNKYQSLAMPSENAPITYYASVDNDLYNNVIMKYMGPMEHHEPRGGEHVHAR